MATTIITKHSATAKDPAPSQLERGELAIDLERKNIYTKDASDEVVQLGGRPVKIGATAPPTPQEGDLWMEVPTAVDQPAMMWVYDGDKWLEHPSGVDGAPGADGNIADATEQGVIATWDNTSGQWTPESGVTFNSGTTTFETTSGNSTLFLARGDTGVRAYLQSGNAGYVGTQTDNAFSVTAHAKAVLTVRPDLSAEFAGDGYFSGNIQIGNNKTIGNLNTCIEFKDAENNILPVIASGASRDAAISIGKTGMRFKDAHFSGNVYATNVFRDGNVLTSAKDLIETLHTLREATKDESTLEGLRDAIGNAVGGLIEKFEAMQSTATQEIADE